MASLHRRRIRTMSMADRDHSTEASTEYLPSEARCPETVSASDEEYGGPQRRYLSTGGTREEDACLEFFSGRTRYGDGCCICGGIYQGGLLPGMFWVLIVDYDEEFADQGCDVYRSTTRRRISDCVCSGPILKDELVRFARI
jgi:hypothetical protein